MPLIVKFQDPDGGVIFDINSSKNNCITEIRAITDHAGFLPYAPNWFVAVLNVGRDAGGRRLYAKVLPTLNSGFIEVVLVGNSGESPYRVGIPPSVVPIYCVAGYTQP